jgi:serine/threonine protein kinase
MGSTFAGRYVLLTTVGRGGVSEVYRAVDPVCGRDVAIKMLEPVPCHDQRVRHRLRREAVLTARMRHPSVPAVYDWGDAPAGGGRVVPYLALRFLVGAPLARRLTRGPLAWPEAVHVAATIADVVAVAHRRGIVHRDISPANVMLTGDGPKIIDFGVAVLVPPGSGDPAIGARAGLFGEPVAELPGPGPTTAGAAEPAEVVDLTGPGEPADDVYALGMLLYHMLVGRSAYAASSTRPLPWAAPTPVLAVPGLPRDIAELCRLAMAKRPADRPHATTLALSLWSTLVAALPPQLPAAR